MLYKDYKFSTYTGTLSSYRDSDFLMINEIVEQNNEINRLITLQIAKDQINQAVIFEELHGMDFSDSFLEGFTLGKEYFSSAVQGLLKDIMDEEDLVMTLHGGGEPQITLFDDDKIETEKHPNLVLVEEGTPTDSAPSP